MRMRKVPPGVTGEASATRCVIYDRRSFTGTLAFVTLL